MLTLKYLFINAFPASPLLIYVTAAILLYLHTCGYTPAVLTVYSHFSVIWCMLLYSALLLLYSCFVYNRAVILLYLYCCFTRTLLLFCNCCNPVSLKYMHVYTRALLLLDSIFVWALQSKTRKRHLALVFKGLHALHHFIAELKHEYVNVYICKCTYIYYFCCTHSVLALFLVCVCVWVSAGLLG